MIGKPAPAWTSGAYVNGAQKTVSSADFAGKWYVLYWYPLDFTFVCPTEIKGFQALLSEFADDGIGVVGASTDSFFSHQAWFADRSIFPDEITHPVLADTNHSVSRAFDVLKEEAGIAFRATVIVDDKGIIRSINVNDTQVGRSPSETLRTVQGFMAGGLCGADWKKGDSFVA
ncbi:MAG: peroxiredoxin [Myxococcales bacterium]|nr:peroxiredoxin [Myxococcales bacterium]